MIREARRPGGRRARTVAAATAYYRTMSDSSLAELLRSRGLRLTAQRQLVLEAV